MSLPFVAVSIETKVSIWLQQNIMT